MAKSGGSKKSKKPVKKTAKKTAGKKGDLQRLLNEIAKRNQSILKEARKIEELLGKIKPVPKDTMAVLTADDCIPGMSISNNPSNGG